MIYDFYGKFSEIYPLDIHHLKDPDREKWGYFWDMEDYMFSGRNDRGILLQGIMLKDPDDLEFFKGIFNLNFKKTKINSIIKEAEVSDFLDIKAITNDQDVIDSTYKGMVRNFSDSLLKLNQERLSYFKELELSVRRGGIWLSLNHYWTDLIRKETEDFWGRDVRIFRLPLSYSSMNDKILWEESIEEGGIEFTEDIAWEEFSHRFTKLVKYIDEEIRERIKVNYLKDLHDFGIF